MEPQQQKIVFFNGSLVEGRMEGFCKLKYKNGVYKEGFFVKDLLQGDGLIAINSRVKFEGKFIRDVLEGEGCVELEGEKFRGKFEKGIFRADTVITNNSLVIF